MGGRAGAGRKPTAQTHAPGNVVDLIVVSPALLRRSVRAKRPPRCQSSTSCQAAKGITVEVFAAMFNELQRVRHARDHADFLEQHLGYTPGLEDNGKRKEVQDQIAVQRRMTRNCRSWWRWKTTHSPRRRPTTTRCGDQKLATSGRGRGGLRLHVWRGGRSTQRLARQATSVGRVRAAAASPRPATGRVVAARTRLYCCCRCDSGKGGGGSDGGNVGRMAQEVGEGQRGCSMNCH